MATVYLARDHKHDRDVAIKVLKPELGAVLGAEIFVRPFPNDGARIQVSSNGGAEPIWDRTGRTLYYRTTEGIVATSVTTAAEFAIGARRLALPGTDAPDATHPSYDITPDGKRFLVLRAAATETKAVVVHNWGRELRERVRGATP